MQIKADIKIEENNKLFDLSVLVTLPDNTTVVENSQYTTYQEAWEMGQAIIVTTLVNFAQATPYKSHWNIVYNVE